MKTHAKMKNLSVQDRLLQAMERSLQVKFLSSFQANILGAKTEKLLEYWHLLENPKYQHAWNTSSSNEFRMLA